MREEIRQNKIVKGKYRVLSLIAHGGMSTIYLADHVNTGELVALKIIKDDLKSDRSAKARFLREVHNSRSLKHRNIVEVMEGDEENSEFFMVLEYMDRGTLHAVLKKIGTVPWPFAVFALIEVCSGLYYTHRQENIHRDMKPENLMLNSQGVVKIADFGISKSFEATAMTKEGEILGTPAYMAPEQIVGNPVNAKSDIFSCGVILYELLTGNNPFYENQIHQTAMRILHFSPPLVHTKDSMIPKELSTLIQKMLEKDPSHRPGSILEVKSQLQEILKLSPTPISQAYFKNFINAPAKWKVDIEARLAEYRRRELVEKKTLDEIKTRVEGFQAALEIIDVVRYGPANKELLQLLGDFLRRWKVILPNRIDANLQELTQRYESQPSKTLLMRLLHLHELSGNTLSTVRYLGHMREERPEDLFVLEKIYLQLMQLKKLIAKFFHIDDESSRATLRASIGLTENDELVEKAEQEINRTLQSAARPSVWANRALWATVGVQGLLLLGLLVPGSPLRLVLTNGIMNSGVANAPQHDLALPQDEHAFQVYERYLTTTVRNEQVRKAYLNLMMLAADKQDEDRFLRVVKEFTALFPGDTGIAKTLDVSRGLPVQQQMEMLLPLLRLSVENSNRK